MCNFAFRVTTRIEVKFTGETLLNGPGFVCQQKAMEKAEQEYRLFQVRELSPVEQAYLETIKALNAKAKGEVKK